METHEKQLNELQSRDLAIRSRMSESDRAALDYVKGLPGFAQAYPEFAQAFNEAKAEEEANDEAIEEVLAEWEFHLGEWVNAGDIIIYNGERYVVLQGHTLQADWIPDQVPALYRRQSDPGEEWPEWVQPTGAHDAYKKGDKVTFEGQHYVSLIDGNVWSPAVYPQGWELHE